MRHAIALGLVAVIGASLGAGCSSEAPAALAALGGEPTRTLRPLAPVPKDVPPRPVLACAPPSTPADGTKDVTCQYPLGTTQWTVNVTNSACSEYVSNHDGEPVTLHSLTCTAQQSFAVNGFAGVRERVCGGTTWATAECPPQVGAAEVIHFIASNNLPGGCPDAAIQAAECLANYVPGDVGTTPSAEKTVTAQCCNGTENTCVADDAAGGGCEVLMSTCTGETPVPVAFMLPGEPEICTCACL